jgi:Holliday junction resolvasome RuvABC endonuclease subunit
MEAKYLIAVDPSLTCSGWAMFELNRHELSAVGKIRSLSSKYPLATRLLDLQRKISNLFTQLGLSQRDILICEAQTTMRDPKAAFKVEQVRGIFETIARSKGLNVPGRLNPRSVHNELLGLRGRQHPREVVKEVAVNVVFNLMGKSLEKIGFPNDIRKLRENQDIVDAILVGNLALSRIETAQLTSLSIEEVLLPSSKGRSGKSLMR